MVQISRQEIDQSGDSSIADVLRGQTFNSFGSFSPTSGTGAAQGGAQVDLRGLGSERTLVLIDGRRLPNNPAFSGAAQNINNIPMALVERVEILREGASAIYGSDAIGGVINIITRKDYSGMQFGTQLDRPDGPGGDANTATLAGGLSNGEGNLYFALEYYDKGMITNRDREVARNLSSALGFPGTIYQYDANGNAVAQPSNPDGGGNPRNFRPFDGCPTEGFDTDPNNQDSALISGRCRYRFASVAALTADVKRQSLTLGGNYNLPYDLTGFARVSLVSAESFGRFAPAPVDSIVEGVNAPDANGNLGVRIGPNNPNNPNPGSTLVLNYRPTFLGPRDNTVDDQVNQYLAGVKGTLFDFYGFNDWEVAVSYNDYKQHDSGINYGLARELQDAIDDGRFNPFDPDPAVADEFRYTTLNNNHFTSSGIDAKINYELDVMEMIIPFAFGMEYRDDDFAVISDSQSAQAVFFDDNGAVTGFQQSNVFGSAGGSAKGARSYKAAFMETAVNLFDNMLELGFALRFDDYSDVGNAVSPKFSIGYRPLDTVLVRGSFSSGFRAPDLTSMYGAPAKSAEPTVDRVACRDNPNDEVACETNQRTVIFDSNPRLDAEDSESLSVGGIWNVTEQLSLTLDYYDIRVENAITQLAPQTVFDNELRCDQEGRDCDARSEGYVVRTDGGGLVFAYSPAVNAAKLETNGLDLGLNYSFDIEGYGHYSLSANVSRTLSYKRQDAPTAPFLERLDSLNGNGEIYPKFRVSSMLAWNMGMFSSALGANYISKVTDCDAPDKEAGAEECGNKLGDYLTIDLQVGVDTPWNQNVTVGIRNLFDEEPQISQYTRSVSTSGTFYGLHDIDQRVAFIRFTQNF